MVEKNSLCQIFEIEILMDLHALGAPESKNHIFSRWSESKTNYSRNCKFWYSTFVSYVDANLKLFMKITQIVSVQGHSKEFLCIVANGWNFLLMHFNAFRLQ